MKLNKRNSLICLSLTAIIGISIFLRLYHLGEWGLWQDELHSFMVSKQPLSSFSTILSKAVNPYPPIYFSLMHFILPYIDRSEFLFRLLPAFFGILTIPFMFLFGKFIGGIRTGLIAVFLLAISPFHIRYSQEGRMYSMLIFFSIISIYFLIKALHKGDKSYWVGFVLVSAANIYTHYYAFLPLFSSIIYGVLILFIRSNRNEEKGEKIKFKFSRFLKISIPLWLSFFCIMISYIPWFPKMYNVLFKIKVIPPFPNQIKEYTYETFVEIFSQLGFGPKASFLVTFVLFWIGIAYLLYNHQFQKVILFTVFLFLPFLMIWLISPPILHTRYLLFLIPFYLLPVTLGIVFFIDILKSFKTKLAFYRILSILIVFFFIFFLFAKWSYKDLKEYYNNPRGADLKPVLLLLSENVKSSDLVYMGSANMVSGWYSNQKFLELHHLIRSVIEGKQEIVVEEKNRIWIGCPIWTYNAYPRFRQFLKENFFKIPFYHYFIFIHTPTKDPVSQQKEGINLLRQAIRVSPYYLPLKVRLKKAIGKYEKLRKSRKQHLLRRNNQK